MSNQKQDSQDEAEVVWVMTEKGKERLPKWARSAAVRSDGTVFLPAAYAGNENMVFLCAGYDGDVPVLSANHHLYIPTWWIAREYPELRERLEAIERNAQKTSGQEEPKQS